MIQNKKKFISILKKAIKIYLITAISIIVFIELSNRFETLFIKIVDVDNWIVYESINPTKDIFYKDETITFV